MGLSSLPSPSEGVLTLVLVNTALTVSLFKHFLRSLLHFFRLRSPPPPLPENHLRRSPPEPSLTDRFRRRFKPVRFGSSPALVRSQGPRRPDCRVCLARFEAESVVDRLPCGHLFHKACLERWLDYHHATCPLCRSHLLPGDDPWS